jgi:hypothetical protein
VTARGGQARCRRFAGDLKKQRAIESVVDLLARRPRACLLPVAKNMLIDCGGAGLRGGAALRRAKPARRDSTICAVVRERRVGALKVVFRPGSSAG